MYSFSDLETVRCSKPSSNCCFLTSIQISQNEGQVVWHCHLFKNFPQLAVIHTVNVNILGISELKWTGMAEFNSDDRYIYYCGENPLEEME